MLVKQIMKSKFFNFIYKLVASIAIHVAIWSLIFSFSNLFHYPEHIENFKFDLISKNSFPWELLMFPTERSYLFSDKGLNHSNESTLNDPVVVGKEEAMAGSVMKYFPDGTHAYVAYASLTLLPKNTNKMKFRGSYGHNFSWEWKANKIDNDLYKITFDHSDNKHARTNRYIYITDGKKIFNVKRGVISGVGMGIRAFFWILITFPLSFFIIFCGAYLMNKRSIPKLRDSSLRSE